MARRSISSGSGVISTSTDSEIKGMRRVADRTGMRCRRLSYVCALVTLLTLSPATAAAKPGTSWAQAELKTVVAAGLMAKAAAARPNDSLTRGELDAIVAGLTHTQPVTAANPSAKVTMAALDSRLVAALGLTETAQLFTQDAKSAGLAPPVSLRDRGRRPAARSPHESSGRPRQARALARRARNARRSRVLRRPDAPTRRV